MNLKLPMAKRNLATPLAAALVISACLFSAGGCGGGGKNPIDGKYVDAKSGLLSFHFHSGSCEMIFMGFTREFTYEVAGNKITLRRWTGAVETTLTRNADGSLIDDRSGNKLIKTTQ
jgi:hypothetical protein